MKVNVYFWLIVLILMLMVAVIVAQGLESGGWMFYMAEGGGAVVLILLFMLYRKIVRPIRIISGGMDLLAQQDFASRLVPVGQAEADRIVDMFNQMMDCLKQQRLHVREQNRFLDLLIDASPMGILTFDQTGCVSAVNDAAVMVFDRRTRDEIEGKCLSELAHPLARVLMSMTRDEVRTVRLSDSRIYKCSMLSYMDSGWAHPFVLVESMTDEVMAAEKQAYGKVIRMIAHEVNNTMCGVGSMLASVSSALSIQDADMSSALSACEERCGDLSRFISRFAEVVKLPDSVLAKVELNGFIESASAFLQTLCTPAGIRLSLGLGDTPVHVHIDMVQFRQVLVNIVKNSVESICASSASKGLVDITVTVYPEPGIVVTDNGAGISHEAACNLFSPFYSTKPYGNGIGLTLVADVLKKHNCRFSLVTSESDGLTRFTINFPKRY